jgi:hypothetical protein
MAIAKFGYQFFGRRQGLRFATALVLLFAGGVVNLKHTDVSDSVGLTLLLAGGGILWWTLFVNFLRTNVVYGIVGSALQLLLLVTFFSTGVFILFLVGGFLFVVFSVVQPVVVVNRRTRRN